MILVLLPVILNHDIGDDITHSDVYKHDYTEVVKGLSMVLLQFASPSGKWEQAGTAIQIVYHNRPYMVATINSLLQTIYNSSSYK